MPRESVGLVDEQHSAACLFTESLGLDWCLADVCRNQLGAVGFHHVALFEDPQRLVEVGHHPSHGGLARARVASEHQVR